jgi:hypothetical protein
VDRSLPSATKVLNFGLATFLVALPAMVLVYRWVVASPIL